MHEPKNAPFYSQLQPWTTVDVISYRDDVAGPPEPQKTGQYYQIPRPLLLRPRIGIEEQSLPKQRARNVWAEATIGPDGKKIDPPKPQKMLTGIVRNPGLQPRAVLYSRYTPFEWARENAKYFGDLETNMKYSQRLRKDCKNLIKETKEEISDGQLETQETITNGIKNVILLRNKQRRELQRQMDESGRMQNQDKLVQKAIDDIQERLLLAQECLYQREQRQGIDLCFDDVEQALVEEIKQYRINQDKLNTLFSLIQEQRRTLREAEHHLESDSICKESALGIDNLCSQLNNLTKGITYYAGIDRYDPAITNTLTWKQNAIHLVGKAKEYRKKSYVLRQDITDTINGSIAQMMDAWKKTNNALARRVAELEEAKRKLEILLDQVKVELAEVSKYTVLLEKAITDKIPVSKLAYTRLEARTRRPFTEACRDQVQERLVREIHNIQDTMETLRHKLHEAEAQKQRLLQTRSNIEDDIKNKSNSIWVDREKCLNLRKEYDLRLQKEEESVLKC